MDVFKQVRIAQDSKARLIALRTELFKENVTRLSKSLYEGRITIGQFQEDMKTRLRLLHTGATAIGKGSWRETTSRDWGRVGAVLKEQYRYLQGFAQDISDRRETITEKQIAWRARLYGDKGGYSAALAQGGDVTGFLPWIPKDGTTLCQNGCRCEWQLVAGPPRDGDKSVTAVWVLHPAEHCETCVGRDGFSTSFAVPEEVEVPSRIGGY